MKRDQGYSDQDRRVLGWIFVFHVDCVVPRQVSL